MRFFAKEQRMRIKQVVGILAVGGLVFGVQLGAAQSKQTKSAAGAAKSTAAKAGGATHTHTGCLAKGTDPNTYMLTGIEGTGPKQVELINVPATLNLAPHVGHKVAITGTDVSAKAAARAESGAKKGAKGAMKEEAGEHNMAPTALKMVSTSCS
jgi:hypothetical protein